MESYSSDIMQMYRHRRLYRRFLLILISYLQLLRLKRRIQELKDFTTYLTTITRHLTSMLRLLSEWRMYIILIGNYFPRLHVPKVPVARIIKIMLSVVAVIILTLAQILKILLVLPVKFLLYIITRRISKRETLVISQWPITEEMQKHMNKSSGSFMKN